MSIVQNNQHAQLNSCFWGTSSGKDAFLRPCVWSCMLVMLPLLDAIIPFVKGAWPGIHADHPRLLMTGATKLLIKYACISLTSRQRATKRKPSWHVAKGWMCRDFQRWQSYRNQHAVSSSCLVQWGVLTVCCHR